MTTTHADTAFVRYSACERLRKLAKMPFDLTKQGQLTPERIDRYVGTSCGYRLLYAMERVNDDVMVTLKDLAREAKVLEKMAAMQAGDVINRIEGYVSENRSVLHTALRDFFDRPNGSATAAQAAAKAKSEHEKLKSFLDKINKEKRFSQLIAVAIGGSDLGPRALYTALKSHIKGNRKVHFVSNVDPDDIAGTLKQVDLCHTLVVVVSKSGTTIETLTNEEFLRERYRQAGLKPEEYFVCVTEEGSPMDDPKRYLACFHLWNWVGGRFSGTSMGAAVTLGFACGYEVFGEILRGAHAMDLAALQPDISSNLPLLGALLAIWNRNFLGYSTLAFVPYSEALSRFSAHMQQVEMESNGKRIDRQGHGLAFDTAPIIWGEPGTNAQHSFYQMIHQGTTIVPVEFVGFKESQYGEDFSYRSTTCQEKLLSNLFAQAIALAVGQGNANPNKVFPGNRPSHILLAKKLTPYALGALYAYIEHKVAFEGFLWDINSFDQEGVQLGKTLASKIMALYAAKNPGGKAAPESLPLGEALMSQLEQVH